MPPDVESRYHQALADLEVNRRWYQLGTDNYFAAVIAAIDNIDIAEIVERDELLHELLSARNDLHLIRRSIAAVTAARGLDVATFVSASEAVADTLKAATRSVRFRRVAGAVTVTSGRLEYDVLHNRAITLYESWQARHRILTTAGDIVLAAISEGVGVDPMTALDRVEVASEKLAGARYKDAWEVARILSLDEPEASVSRFLGVADLVRGRRSKPLTDRQSAVAVAALAQHSPAELPKLMTDRLQAVHIKRWRPDTKTVLSIAALLTLGASISNTHHLYPAFHGFVLREHYISSFAEASAS